MTASPRSSVLKRVFGEGSVAQAERRIPFRVIWRQHWPMYLMLIPAAIMMALFNYYPIYGIVIAFKEFRPALGIWGSPWVGLANFRKFLANPSAWNVLRNTVTIAVGKIVLGQIVSVLFALFLNEVRHKGFKRVIQTGTTLTHFLSWVIIGGMMLQILSTGGVLNTVLKSLGAKPVRFLGKPEVFPWTLILSDIWKEFGWGAVIYLAALTNINPELYEAAAVDGAGRFARMRHVSIPGITPIIVLMACLSLGGVLSAGFEQILILYNPMVYKTGDVLDTFVYRIGLLGAGGVPDYSLGTAVGLLKGIVGFILILISYWLADKFANYRIF